MSSKVTIQKSLNKINTELHIYQKVQEWTKNYKKVNENIALFKWLYPYSLAQQLNPNKLNY